MRSTLYAFSTVPFISYLSSRHCSVLVGTVCRLSDVCRFLEKIKEIFDQHGGEIANFEEAEGKNGIKFDITMFVLVFT